MFTLYVYLRKNAENELFTVIQAVVFLVGIIFSKIDANHW